MLDDSGLSTDLWLAGLAVLECPIDIEKKKEILLSQLKFHQVSKPFTTGLLPFDNAMELTYNRHFKNDSISE